MKIRVLWTVPLLAAFVVGCEENPAIDPNNAPVAVAWLELGFVERLWVKTKYKNA